MTRGIKSQSNMQVLVQLYNLVHIVGTRRNKLFGLVTAKMVLELVRERRGARLAINWSMFSRVWIPTIGSPCRSWGQGYAKFAFGNREELSAVSTCRRGQRAFISCTVSKRRRRKRVSEIWTWRRGDLSQYR